MGRRGSSSPLVYMSSVTSGYHHPLQGTHQQSTAMAAFKIFVLFAVAAVCALASAEEKKEGMMMMKYADDDGSYWPGKYERSMVMPAAYHSVMPGVVPAMHAMHPAVYPYGYAHIPAARTYVI